MRRVDVLKNITENYRDIDKEVYPSISAERELLTLVQKELEWQCLSNSEKQEKRKKLFKYMTNMDMPIEVLREIFKLEICIIEFYDILESTLKTLDLMDKDDVSVIRLKGMLFIEKMFLNEFIDARKMRHHNFNILNRLFVEYLNDKMFSHINILSLNQKLIEKENLLNTIDKEKLI